MVVVKKILRNFSETERMLWNAIECDRVKDAGSDQKAARFNLVR